MAWELDEKETSAALKLAAPKRYEYLVKKAADENRLWSLWNNGWVLGSDDIGRELVPVWSHQDYAVICAVGEWLGSVAKEIDLQVWLQRWIPGIEQDGRLIAVFPTPEDRGVVVNPNRLAVDLKGELSKY